MNWKAGSYSSVFEGAVYPAGATEDHGICEYR